MTSIFYTIQQVANLSGLSVYTLRYYERIGLLDPLARAASGHRRFGAADLAWLECLTRLRTTGMSIREIRRFADLRRRGSRTVGLRRRLLEEHARTIARKLATLQENLRIVRRKIDEDHTLEVSDDGQ